MKPDYRVKHLFLLVGENPLPNYVAARTLLAEEGIVYLVFTSGTKEQKESLQIKLKDVNIKTDLIDLGSQESNAYEISQKIETKVKKIAEQESIGLNYTGGTKAMAVHAYQTIQKLNPEAIFSYLDSRRLKMCIDQKDSNPIPIEIQLQLSLEDIFNLHKLYLLKKFPPLSQPIFPELAEEIFKIYSKQYKDDKGKHGYLDKDFKNWCDKPNNNNTWYNSFPELKQMLEDYLYLTTDKVQITEKTKEAGFTKFDGEGDFQDWLKGTWLESYVLKEIQAQVEALGIDSENCQMSFNLTDDIKNISTNKKEKDAKFEFDIAFVKGYQLFAISCTTKSKKSDCKEKLFEAYLRAKQLGGDEARVALISCYKFPEEIQKETKKSGVEDIKIKVFGRHDLADIGNKIVEWVDEVERSAKNL